MKSNIKGWLYYIYAKLFARKIFLKFHQIMFELSIRGMGVLNYKNGYISGEETILKKLSSLFKDEEDFYILDIGANVGNYTKLLSANFPQANILSFEINPLVFNNLKINTRYLKNITTLDFGLSSKTDTIELFDYNDTEGSEHASIYKEVFSELHKSKQISTIKCKVMNGDDFINSQSKIKTIKFIKIDTEGHELEVIKGLQKTIIKLNPIIQFEFNDMNIISKTSFLDIMNHLPGYQLYRLMPNSLARLDNQYPGRREIYAFQNIIAIPKSKLEIVNLLI